MMTDSGGALDRVVDDRASETQSLVEDERALGRAQELLRVGRLAEAEVAYRRVLAGAPGHPLCLHHLGLIAHRRGDHAEAVELLSAALAARPDYVEAMSNLGAVFRALGRSAAALTATERALRIRPDFAEAHSNRGAALEDLGRLPEALEAYRRAMGINPVFVEPAVNAANVLRKLGRLAEAVAACEDIVAARPDAGEPLFRLGSILKDMRRESDAVEAYRRALVLRPDFAECHVGIGNVLQTQGDYEGALEAYARAIALRPAMADAHVNRGAALERLGRLAEAIESYRRAVELDPKQTAVRVWLHHKRRAICDWRGLEEEEEALLRLVEGGGAQGANPFALLSMAATARQQLACTCAAAGELRSKPFDFGPRLPREADAKLRVGFLSSDFCRHATALLAVQLPELIDRARFELLAYSNASDDGSEIGARMRSAFDRLVDIRAMSDEEAARRIHDDGVDVLIDMKGFTAGARLEVMALRPAPVQASFLGFPGTTGADFIDYVLADPIVAPMERQADYSENIVHLPHCYQPNDATRRIAELTPTRAQCGLPDAGFVFCCFNNSYKLTPAVFDVWMRLLAACPGGVLWLLDSNALMRENLRSEAQARGVDPDRLVFAPKTASADHLARHRLADLFLDTLPYNAHTTASDALWAGLPVLTCAGETFAGRVAASLLCAVGLPELVTTSLAEYERLALDLACGDPARLRGIRGRLNAGRLTSALFDAPRYVRNFEAALTRMWEIHASGQAPRPFAVGEAGEPTAVEAPTLRRVPYHACPLCGGADIPVALQADCTRHALYQKAIPAVMNWRECGQCGHVFTDGWFDEAAANVIFAKTHANQMVGHDMERQRLVSARIVERVARRAPAGGDWLDIGFGNGSLLFTAEEWGYVPVGLDLREANVAALKTLGYEAHRLPVEALEQPARFSVVSMADVLEHMPFPRCGLAAAHRLLRPGGALFLSMPNLDNMVWRLLHANGVNPYWGEIEHYHNFSRRRLYALLGESGFEPVEYAVSERYRVCMEVVAIRS